MLLHTSTQIHTNTHTHGTHVREVLEISTYTAGTNKAAGFFRLPSAAEVMRKRAVAATCLMVSNRRLILNESLILSHVLMNALARGCRRRAAKCLMRVS